MWLHSFKRRPDSFEGMFGRGTSRLSLSLPVRHTADLLPILRTNILVNLDRDPLAVESIRPVLAGTRDPVFLAGVNLVIVGLEAAPLEAFESLASIVERLARFRETHPTDASRAGKPVGLVLDVHDAGFHDPLGGHHQ